eukprot:jgi/Tetstr1/430681/TSEL_020474.t1
MLRFVPFAVSEFGSLAPHDEAFLVELAKASHTHIGQKIGYDSVGSWDAANCWPDVKKYDMERKAEREAAMQAGGVAGTIGEGAGGG